MSTATIVASATSNGVRTRRLPAMTMFGFAMVQLGREARAVEAERLFEPEHQVEALHRLARCTLDQIVDHGEDDDRAALVHLVHGDLADVGAAHGARLRMRSG